jgi:membrane protease YdiL (CAAX protease family)
VIPEPGGSPEADPPLTVAPPAAPVAGWPSPPRSGPALLWLLTIAWVLVILGLALVLGGLGAGGLGLYRGDTTVLDWSGAVALAGVVLALAGLTAVAVRGLITRRRLGTERYRGPSILVLLGIVLVAGNTASVQLLGGWTAILTGELQMDAASTSALLFLTHVMLAAALVLFVFVPRALPGVELWPRANAGRLFLLGIGLGVATSIAAALVGALVTVIIIALTGEPPDEQLAVEFVSRVHPLVAVLAVVIVAPIVEELFFRGFVFNAWLREYGMRRAVIGSALLFTVIHVSDPTLAGLLALTPILLVAFVLSYVYARTRSLLTVVALHATFNAISTAIIFLIESGVIEVP